MRSYMILALTAILGGSLLVPAHAKPEKRERAEQSEERGQRDGQGRRDKDKRDQRSERGQQHDGRSEQRGSHKGVLTRDEAARRAQRRYGGRVLSVDLLQSDNAPARYRIKLLSDGNVRTVDVDALED